VQNIGRNIVAWCSRCNGYEVFDLGVMTARGKRSSISPPKRKANIIGLSGLITPSLDENVPRRRRNGGVRASIFH